MTVEIGNTRPWQEFIRVCSLLRNGVVDFPLNGNSEFCVDDHWDERWEKDCLLWEESNAIASTYRDDTHLKGKHALLLDLDVDHVYIPSSTKYHGHLIINTPRGLSFDDMMEILTVLNKHGILEPGYVSAAKARGKTWLRTPWTKKE